jgi:hypothetical protein
VAKPSDHHAAFTQIADELHASAAANARALVQYRGLPAAEALERQLEHTLDRLALLYGRGSYENIGTNGLFATAIRNEVALAHERGHNAASQHLARAQALVNSARRGVRLRVHGDMPSAEALRGVYLAPLRPEFVQSLHERREPYLRWRDGVVVVLSEEELATLRAASDEVDVLYLDPDELLDLAGQGDRPALEAELERRLAAARAAPDRVGDSRERHLGRLLHRQSMILRTLRDRLATDHPVSHRALLPIVSGNRTLLEAALAATPPSGGTPADPLDASIEHERRLQELVTHWAAEPDEAGLRSRFAAVAAAGSHLAELQRHRG